MNVSHQWDIWRIHQQKLISKRTEKKSHSETGAYLIIFSTPDLDCEKSEKAIYYL